jgi:hypothetical protein
MRHDCPENPDLLAPLPPKPNVQIINDKSISENAFTDLRDGTIYVDADFARRLDGDSQQLVLWHEQAHQQSQSCARACDGKPNGCERCADTRMGACAAIAGWDDTRMLRGLLNLNLSRDTLQDDAINGFNAVMKAPEVITPKTSLPYNDAEYIAAPRPSPADSPMVESSPIAEETAAEEIDPVDVAQKITEIQIENVASNSDCPQCRYDCSWVAIVAACQMLASGLFLIATEKTQ